MPKMKIYFPYAGFDPKKDTIVTCKLYIQVNKSKF